MAERSIGFLEHLYGGRLRNDLVVPDLSRNDFSKADDLAERVRAALGEFDAEKIERQARLPVGLMSRLKQLGIFGIIVPREYGGLGFTVAEYLRFVEMTAGIDLALVLVPLTHLSLGIMGLLLYGNEEQKRRYLPRAASGKMIFSFALTEPSVGSDARNIRSEAHLSDDGTSYLLSGTKTYIMNAGYSGAFMVFARFDPNTPGSLGAFVVERRWTGVTVGKDMPKMGLHAGSTAAAVMKEVKVPRENLVGEPGEGFKIAMTILNYGRLALGAASAGLMARSVDEMVARASSRKQFGVPILDFELIQEKIARAKAHAFATTAMTYFTASLLDRDPLTNVTMESSHTKLYGTTRCWDTLYEAMQTAGASGYLSTLPYEKRLRDFRAATILEGTTEIHSVYPALRLFRSYGRLLDKKKTLGKRLLLRKIARTRALTGMEEPHPVLRRAVAVAARSERFLRTLLRTGFTQFGSAVVAEELYLRRMTHLSLSLFWLTASIGFLRARFPNRDIPQSELYLLDYLTAEAEESQRLDARVRRSSKERAQSNIIAALSATAS